MFVEDGRGGERRDVPPNVIGAVGSFRGVVTEASSMRWLGNWHLLQYVLFVKENEIQMIYKFQQLT